MHLKGAVCKHGGKSTPFLSVKGVTHIIAENLSGVKTDKAMKVLWFSIYNISVTHRCVIVQRYTPFAFDLVLRQADHRILARERVCRKCRKSHELYPGLSRRSSVVD